MIAYKVTTDNGQSSWADGKSLVWYEVGEESRASSAALKAGYGLCVFKTIEDALAYMNRGWISRMYKERLFECECDGMIDELPLHMGGSDFEEFFLHIEDRREQFKFSGNVWPAGTMMFAVVRPIREIDVKDLR